VREQPRNLYFAKLETMTKTPWHGIMKVLEIQHLSRDKKVLWERRNLRNMLHLKGEEFLLRGAFTGGRVSTVIPENYYLGLDNRPTILEEQEMGDLISEPTYAGYTRQPVSSSGDFSVVFEDGHYQAISIVVAFEAINGQWGPVQNLFLSDMATTSGILISTTALETAVVVEAGESVTMRLAMSLRDCPP